MGSANPLQAGDILYPMRTLLFIAFLLMGFTLSQPQTARHKEPELFLMDTSLQDPDRTAIQSWQRKVSEKAVERYAAAQDKKWRRWNEAMFERLV